MKYALDRSRPPRQLCAWPSAGRRNHAESPVAGLRRTCRMQSFRRRIAHVLGYLRRRWRLEREWPRFCSATRQTSPGSSWSSVRSALIRATFPTQVFCAAGRHSMAPCRLRCGRSASWKISTSRHPYLRACIRVQRRALLRWDSSTPTGLSLPRGACIWFSDTTNAGRGLCVELGPQPRLSVFCDHQARRTAGLAQVILHVLHGCQLHHARCMCSGWPQARHLQTRSGLRHNPRADQVALHR